jgi:hypothetical protein
VLEEPLAIEELSSLLDRLLAEPRLRRSVGAAARRRALELSLDAAYRRVEECFLEVARERGRA